MTVRMAMSVATTPVPVPGVVAVSTTGTRPAATSGAGTMPMSLTATGTEPLAVTRTEPLPAPRAMPRAAVSGTVLMPAGEVVVLTDAGAGPAGVLVAERGSLIVAAVTRGVPMAVAVSATRSAGRLVRRERVLLSRGHRPIIARTTEAHCSPRHKGR